MRLTLSQMAARLNRCPKTFRKYVDQLNIPHIQLGRDFLFDPDEVTNYLKDRTVEKRENRGAPTRRLNLAKSALAERLGI